MATFFALYGDDIRIIFTTPDYDAGFYNTIFVCLLIFLLEFLIYCTFRDKYLFTFNFWMDLISTCSLVLDIPWLADSILGFQFDGNEVNLLKAGRVSRVTTRAARIVRFIRLIRLIRVGKLYKTAFGLLLLLTVA